MKITQREKQACYEAVGFMPFSKRVMKILGTDWECIDMELDIAVYLIANENAIPFYEKLGMKKSDDVMQFNHIEWTEWTVGSDN